jgi:hypothetical protein
VVIGRAIHEGELAALVNGGLADFVARSGGCLPVALGLVEQRLLRAQKFSTFALPAVLLEDATAEAFGRSSGTNSTIRNGGQQRLETIAELAVRLRETVRRLSQDWETHNRIPQRAVQPRVAH